MTNAELEELEAEWTQIEATTSADEFGRVDVVTIKKIAATVRKVLGVTEKVSMKSLPQFIIRIAQLSSGEHSTIDDVKDAVDDNTIAVTNNTSEVQLMKTAVSTLKTYTFYYQNEISHGLAIQNLSDYTVSGECISPNSNFIISFVSDSFRHGFLSYVRIHDPWRNHPDSIYIENTLGSGKILKIYINSTFVRSLNNNDMYDLAVPLRSYGVINMVFECDGIYMNCYIQGLEE